MRARKLADIKPGNPFTQDAYHMGTYLGTNVCVMYSNFPGEPCEYLIIVDTQTGERLEVTLKK